MKISDQDIKKFYDEYSNRQVKYSFNERHYYVFELLKKAGLNKSSSVLDLGCGIGVLDMLLAEYCASGKIYGLDISERSIEIAKENSKRFTNLSFKCVNLNESDLKEFTNFDFIFLVDVLEHIPFENHPSLFKRIAGILSKNSRLIINIPYYGATVYAEKNQKELLQIVDLPIELHMIVSLCEANNLEIKQVQTYDIWQKEEYQFIVIEKKKEYEYVRLLPEKLSFGQRIKNKLKRFF
jgi:trans-aconitate 2-methyltransferase